MITIFDRKALKKIRKAKRITINEAVFRAEQQKLDLTKTTIINNEQGHTKPHADTLAAYATVYDVPVSSFFAFKHLKSCVGSKNGAVSKKSGSKAKPGMFSAILKGVAHGDLQG